MIWYILFFLKLRNITQPPQLPQSHPLRRAFYNYGYTAARNWLAFILCSIGVAVLTSYPIIVNYPNARTGFSKLPLHVWTSARLYDGSDNVIPDIVVRQIWVHGSHMGALKKDVLLEALRAQDILIPKTVSQTVDVTTITADEPKSLSTEISNDYCSMNSAKFESWGFHSPLMFWNCSSEAILNDLDILGTINNQATRRSYLNLTLRPPSVFAGKQFENGRVVAADGLVITLFGKRTNDSSNIWDSSVDQLVNMVRERGHSLYPRDGHVHQQHLYEFQQKPLSSWDVFLLVGAYFSMLLFVILRLGNLRAIKSRAGLLVAVLFQAAISIATTFSICLYVLKIDLARIPDAMYPFVVFVMGLENMFRLINAIIAQKPELSTLQRIANALGEVGHQSLMSATQLLFALWMISKFAPAVRAFCIFASIALVVDYIFHLTFFLAVLSVDVRRMELRDSIDRAQSVQPARKPNVARPEQTYFLDALLQGRLDTYSRIAGSAISIVFILALNTHFYHASSFVQSFLQSVRSMLWTKKHQPHYVPPPINQARTPAAWLRIQDYRYAREVLQYVKPGDHNIIARVYDPLLVVLHGSNREKDLVSVQSILARVLAVLRKHVYPAVLALVFSIAFITLLMQYLLWNELPEEELTDEEQATSPLLLETLPNSHRLDVVLLAACPKGHIVSVSLDKVVTFALFDNQTHLYSLSSVLASAMTPSVWPIVALALDERGQWAAICAKSGHVVFWNLVERQPSHTYPLFLNDQHVVLFTLTSIEATDDESLHLVVVTADGQVSIVDPFQADDTETFNISNERIITASITRSESPRTIFALTRSGKIRLASYEDTKWTTSSFDKIEQRLAPSSPEGIVKSLVVCPVLNVIGATRLRVVDLVDNKTRTMIHSFPALLVKGNSLRILSSQVRRCSTCKAATAVRKLSLAYNDFESSVLTIRTYFISGDDASLMCLGPRQAGKTYPCKGLANAKEHVHTVEDPGSWEATNVQAIVGLRRKPSGADTPQSTTSECISVASGFDAQQFNLQAFDSIKKRGDTNPSHKWNSLLHPDRATENDQDDWEIWTITIDGDFLAEPMSPAAANERAQSIGEDELLVVTPGPMIRLGQKSVAVGFGDRIKLIMLGRERFEQEPAESADFTQPEAIRRRKLLKKKE